MGARQVIIHIGMDKTGSTAIQQVLNGNPKALERFGYRYTESARYGTINHQALSVTAAQTMNEWRDISLELDRYTQTGIVSFEGLYHYTEEHWNRVLDTLSPHTVSIVFYIRRQSEIICSGIAQRIKTRWRNRAFYEYTEKDFSEMVCGYFDRLECLSRVFGTDRIHLRVYEDSQLIGEDVLTDFFTTIGIDFTRVDIRGRFDLTDQHWNPTIDVETMSVLDHLDKFGVDSRTRLTAVQLLRSISRADRSTLVPPTFTHSIDESYVSDNRLVAEKWFNRETLFLDPPKFIYRQPDPVRLSFLYKLLQENLSRSSDTSYLSEMSIG